MLLIINVFKGEEIIQNILRKRIAKYESNTVKVWKVIKHVINFMLSGKVNIIYLFVGLVKKIQFRNKTSDKSDLVTNAHLKAKVTQIETVITKVTDLVTTAGFNKKATEIENK